jgi:hypothetical protein
MQVGVLVRASPGPGALHLAVRRVSALRVLVGAALEHEVYSEALVLRNVSLRRNKQNCTGTDRELRPEQGNSDSTTEETYSVPN